MAPAELEGLDEGMVSQQVEVGEENSSLLPGRLAEVAGDWKTRMNLTFPRYLKSSSIGTASLFLGKLRSAHLELEKETTTV